VALVLGAATVRPSGAPRAVTYQRGARKGPHFRIPWEGREGQRVPGAEDRRQCLAGRARAKPRAKPPAKSVKSQALSSPSRAREAPPVGRIATFQHKKDGPYWPRRDIRGRVTWRVL